MSVAMNRLSTALQTQGPSAPSMTARHDPTVSRHIGAEQLV